MRPEDRYDSLFQYYGWRSGVDWLLLKADARQESNFNPDVVNPKSRAIGLCQFMPNTWKEWDDGTPGIQLLPGADMRLLDPRDPEDAIQAQAAYFSWLLHRYAGDPQKALAAYNWGPGNLSKCIAAFGDDWKTRLPNETQNYLVRIETYYQQYMKDQN